ncbi:MAG TPA: glycosyltransferase family 4 protein [Solirubrobacteraceae bacterium]|nr:glycosyltransferase family 4 protein [Solirubrobacteraceae bacterium]
MRVLYVNHTAEVSGGERSLLSLLGALPEAVQARVATPAGPLQDAVRALGLPVSTITGTAGSLRLHPLHTPRALLDLARAARQVRAAARAHRAELVHANSIRAGIVLVLARIPRTATVVHVRDCLPPGRLSRAILRLIAARATVVVTNSRYTAANVRAAAPRARLEVIHNPVEETSFDPARIDRAGARARLGAAGERALLLGVVAQLTPWKGQDTAIEALARVCEAGIDAGLLLVGSAKFVARATRFDNRRYVQGLHELAARAGVVERVYWLGEREDVPRLIRALDILLLPSWEEPFGRALIEAMALEVPVIATDVGGPPEILEDGREGLLLPPRSPAAWAEAISRLARDPRLRARMGAAGAQRVARAFTVPHHVAAVLALYERALGVAPAAPAGAAPGGPDPGDPTRRP